MMTEKMVQAFNDQIEFEFSSAYIYLAMSVAMKEAKYPGYAAWLKKHHLEELEHAHKLIAYLQDRDEKVVLRAIPVTEWKGQDPLEVAKAVLAHEQNVTAKIHSLYEEAFLQKDWSTHQFVGWFVAEQVEEEAIARDVIDMFTFAGTDRASQMLVDAKLESAE